MAANLNLVTITCPSCGAAVSNWDPFMGLGNCKFCGHVIKDVNDDSSKHECLSRIAGYMRLGDTNNARAAVSDFQKNYPGDFRGWYGEYILIVPNADRNRSLSYIDEIETLQQDLKNMDSLCSEAWENDFLATERAALRNDQERLESIIQEFGFIENAVYDKYAVLVLLLVVFGLVGAIGLIAYSGQDMYAKNGLYGIFTAVIGSPLILGAGLVGGMGIALIPGIISVIIQSIRRRKLKPILASLALAISGPSASSQHFGDRSTPADAEIEYAKQLVRRAKESLPIISRMAV